LFYTCLHELKDMGGNVIVECDKRLVEVMARSFPEFTIRAEIFLPQQESRSPHSDFDFHLPLGSLMRHFRPTLESFNRSGAYIKPDPVKVAKFQERLAPYKDDYRLIGICWRSGKLDPVRNLSYTTLDEWGEVLRTPSFKFVNLQYGECEAELKEAEEKYVIEILRWPDLNLRNDLDDIFALMDCLDAVLSVQTAVLTMAGCTGAASVGIKAGGWTSLGYKHSPWFSKFVNVGQMTRVIPAFEENSIAQFVAEALSEPAFLRLINKELNNEIGSLPEQQRRKLLDHLRDCLFEQSESIKTTSLYINILKRLLLINPNLSQVIALQALESNLILKTPRQIEERHRLSLATALSFASTGNWDSADRYFNEAAKLNREATHLALPEYAWRNFVDGRLAEAKAHAEAAVKDCRTLESLNDFNIAKIFAHLGEQKIAIEIAGACFHNCKKKRDVFASMCSTFQFLGEHEKALEMLEKQKAVRALKFNELDMQIQSLIKVSPIDDVLKYIENLYSESGDTLRGLFSSLALSSIQLLGLQNSKEICNLDVASGRSSPMTAYFDVVHSSLSDSAYSIQKIVENDLLNDGMKKSRALLFSSISEINLGNPKAALERINYASMLVPNNIFIKILRLALSGGDLKIEDEIRSIYRSTNPFGMFFKNMFYIYGLGFLARSKASAISFQEEDNRLGRYLPLEWVNVVNK
jgi:tetratricopeptide (TPR) repeat protein